jgi:hypothetical protein
MENNANMGAPAKAGTIGGTLAVVMLHITSEEVLKTALLAAVGAMVSFSVSFLLNRMVRRKKKVHP